MQIMRIGYDPLIWGGGVQLRIPEKENSTKIIYDDRDLPKSMSLYIGKKR